MQQAWDEAEAEAWTHVAHFLQLIMHLQSVGESVWMENLKPNNQTLRIGVQNEVWMERECVKIAWK